MTIILCIRRFVTSLPPLHQVVIFHLLRAEGWFFSESSQCLNNWYGFVSLQKFNIIRVSRQWTRIIQYLKYQFALRTSGCPTIHDLLLYYQLVQVWSWIYSDLQNDKCFNYPWATPGEMKRFWLFGKTFRLLIRFYVQKGIWILAISNPSKMIFCDREWMSVFPELFVMLHFFI